MGLVVPRPFEGSSGSPIGWPWCLGSKGGTGGL